MRSRETVYCCQKMPLRDTVIDHPCSLLFLSWGSQVFWHHSAALWPTWNSSSGSSSTAGIGSYAVEAMILATTQAWEQEGTVGGAVREIIGAIDETFLEQMMLVFFDLRTGSIVLEDVAEDRSDATWKALVDARLKALGTEVLYLVNLVSDRPWPRWWTSGGKVSNGIWSHSSSRPSGGSGCTSASCPWSIGTTRWRARVVADAKPRYTRHGKCAKGL